MKCVLLLFTLAAVSASQDKPKSGYSYYVSSNWPSGSHLDKKPAGIKAAEVVREERTSSSDDNKQPQSNSLKDEPSYGSREDYGYRDDYYRVIGRHGLGFERRVASADGLRRPTTPELLEHVGRRPTVKELKYAPL